MLFEVAFSLAAVTLFALGSPARAEAAPPDDDAFTTSGGELRITFIGHAALPFDYAGKILYVDPYGKVGDYSTMPPADLVLLTHEHADHLDLTALGKITVSDTPIILTGACLGKLGRGTTLQNGQTTTIDGIKIEAVPAYNIVHKREDGEPFHPKGRGNGYVLTFGDKRVYVAGDTENIPEMAALKNIDIAFLPMCRRWTAAASAHWCGCKQPWPPRDDA